VTELVLGVDLDGVCADYESALRRSVAARRGVDLSELPPQETTGHFAEWGLTPAVAEVLWRLSDAGVWIRIITHRLLFNGLHEVSAADTAFWLDRHDIPYRDLCFIGDKATVGSDLIVDDSPHNIAALRDAGRTAIVFDQRYNAHLAGPRITHWTEIEPLVAARLASAPTAGAPTTSGTDEADHDG